MPDAICKYYEQTIQNSARRKLKIAVSRPRMALDGIRLEILVRYPDQLGWPYARSSLLARCATAIRPSRGRAPAAGSIGLPRRNRPQHRPVQTDHLRGDARS